jgi:hypothetical protein
MSLFFSAIHTPFLLPGSSENFRAFLVGFKFEIRSAILQIFSSRESSKGSVLIAHRELPSHLSSPYHHHRLVWPVHHSIVDSNSSSETLTVLRALNFIFASCYRKAKCLSALPLSHNESLLLLSFMWPSVKLFPGHQLLPVRLVQSIWTCHRHEVCWR